MVSPPRNLAFRGSEGRSGAFAALGQASTPRTPRGLLEPRKRLLCQARSSGQVRQEHVSAVLRKRVCCTEG